MLGDERVDSPKVMSGAVRRAASEIRAKSAIDRSSSIVIHCETETQVAHDEFVSVAGPKKNDQDQDDNKE